MKLISKIALIVIIVTIVGCMTTPSKKRKESELQTLTLVAEHSDCVDPEQVPEHSKPSGKEILSHDTSEVPEIDEYETVDNVLEPTLQPVEPVVDVYEPYYLIVPAKSHIKRCKKYYLEKYRRDYLSGLAKRENYCFLIETEIAKRNLPSDFKWIPMVETWFENSAQSKAHAVGLWQLIPATAKTFGLTINEWVDDRKDPKKATSAALDTLEYLYSKTGDWLLTLAAYNSGEGCVNRAIRKAGSRNYWDLAKNKLLPSQTRFYVSAILALSEIERESELNNVIISDCIPREIVGVALDKRVNLFELSQQVDITLSEFKLLNPSLKTMWTPPVDSQFVLNCPSAKVAEVSQAIEKLSRKPSENIVAYTIQAGDTLGKLARQYHSTVDAIMKANRMEKHLIIVGRTLFIPTGITWN